jgi:hypothetical protein
MVGSLCADPSGTRENRIPSGAVWSAGTLTGTIDLGTEPLTTNTLSAFLWKVN